MYNTCPVLVFDDVLKELLQVSHALSICGFPVKPHLIKGGSLDVAPANRYSGVRLIFTDLHIIGPHSNRPEMYVSALINIIQSSIEPSNYVIVFWSAYEHEAKQAWDILSARIDATHCPIGYFALPKSLASDVMEEDSDDIAVRHRTLRDEVMTGLSKFPQIEAISVWEAAATKAVAQTSDGIFDILRRGSLPVDGTNVRAVMARMAQEALGYPYAETNATRGLMQALLPILQDRMERTSAMELETIRQFLAIDGPAPIALPGTGLAPLLNDFFIHAEGDVASALERGAVIRLTKDYLERADGFRQDAGVATLQDDWRLSICREFAVNWKNKESTAEGTVVMEQVSSSNVFAIELSAICDHAQGKRRTQRFLIGIFVPAEHRRNFTMNAHDALVQTPEITLEGVPGTLLVSCKIFISRRFGESIEGTPITRLRPDVIDEISHRYSTHIRRPGKIAFF